MSRGQPPRDVIRDRDGHLFDVSAHRPVTIAELAEDVRAGRRFRVREQHSDRVCTQAVLLEVLRHAAPLPTSAAQTPLPTAGLAGIAGVLGDTLARAARRDDRDHEPAPRRPRGRSRATGFPLPDEETDA